MGILDSYAAYGCRVNAVSIDDLFRRYRESGFLYPQKMRRLAPFMPLIRENWTRMQRAGEALHDIVTCDESDGAQWASVSNWRSTSNAWVSQHLAGVGGPKASGAVMLSSQAAFVRDPHRRAMQNWFQRSNRLANKVFGTMERTLDRDCGWVGDYSYFAVSVTGIPSPDASVDCGQAGGADQVLIRSLATRARSAVFCTAEGLDQEDLALEATDEMYRKVGLRRYRQVAVARSRSHDGLAGMALAYRGPLGLNFSFLENRCDLILDPTLRPEDRGAVIRSLLRTAAGCYADFPPATIPVTVDTRHASFMNALGADHVRDYAQNAWVRDGYEAWYWHIHRIYDRVIQAGHRRGLARKQLAGITA